MVELTTTTRHGGIYTQPKQTKRTTPRRQWLTVKGRKKKQRRGKKNVRNGWSGMNNGAASCCRNFVAVRLSVGHEVSQHSAAKPLQPEQARA